MLEMQLPIGFSDRLGIERAILPELLKDAREQRSNPIASIAPSTIMCAT